MSSTRDRKRDGIDTYPTPAWAVRAVLPVLSRLYPGGIRHLMEPAAGEGAIVREVAPLAHGASILCVDVRDIGAQAVDALVEDVADECLAHARYTVSNFLELAPSPSQDLVITNPPYSLALEFIQRSLEWVHENGWVVMLLRLPFLEGQKRSEWMRIHMPDVYVLPKRPSFTGHGTDSCAYAWMAWPRRERRSGRVEILEVPA